MIQIYAAVGEQEARAISARTKAALQAAKARGTVLGQNGRKLAERNKQQASTFATSIFPTINEIRASGITTLNGIAQALTERQVKTFRGNTHWQAVQVRNLLNQAQIAV